MKPISRLVFCGIFSLALIRPVFGLAFGSPDTEVEPSPLLLPPLAFGSSVPLSLKGLVPPGLDAGARFPAYPLVWRSVERMGSLHTSHPAGDRMAISAPLPQLDIPGLTLWPEPELRPPGAHLPEQARLLEDPEGGNLGAISAAVTVPEPMGRTLLGLGLAGLILRGRLSVARVRAVHPTGQSLHLQ